MMEQKVLMTDPRKIDSYYEEAIKTLRTNIQFSGIEMKVILMTSCYPNEGKSDVVFQLAREMGKIRKKVLLMDADIRKSSFVKRFQVEGEITGLSHLLSGQAVGKNIIYSTNYPNVDMIFAGPSVPNPSELLSQKAFGSLIDILKERYDYILVDTPPVASVIDAVVVAKQCDAALLVIESDTVSHKMAAKVKEQLDRTGCKVLGAVLNKADVTRDKYYAKYGYYYQKTDKKAESRKK